MKILISNDDGVHAEGIAALANELKKEHDVVICAPDMERSGASHSLTFAVPLVATPLCAARCEDVSCYAISGTPADCVKLGCSNIEPKAEMVVSGINHGANVGIYVLYSGTVSAAMEAAALGFPSLAVSMDGRFPKHLSTAAVAAARAVRMMKENPLPKGCLLNMNVPDLPLEEIKGVKVAKLAHAMKASAYEQRQDPYGRDYFWLPNFFGDAQGEETDIVLLKQGYITVTPLKVDWVDHESLNFVEDHYIRGIKDGTF